MIVGFVDALVVAGPVVAAVAGATTGRVAAGLNGPGRSMGTAMPDRLWHDASPQEGFAFAFSFA